jgi:RNA polymerase sigma factor (sigma-70 family)
VPASDVDDVVAEAFTKTLAAIRRGRGPADQPMRYLMIAVRHTAYRSGSQRIRLAELAARNTDATPTSVAAPELGDEALVGAFAALAPRWRQALWLSEVEGLSPVELGDRLDLTPAAAAALTYRARRALRATYGLAAAG